MKISFSNSMIDRKIIANFVSDGSKLKSHDFNLAASAWSYQNNFIKVVHHFPNFVSKTGEGISIFESFIKNMFYGRCCDDKFQHFVKSLFEGLKNQSKKQMFDPHYLNFMMTKVSETLEYLDNPRSLNPELGTDMPKTLLLACADLYEQAQDDSEKMFFVRLSCTVVDALSRPFEEQVMLPLKCEDRASVSRATLKGGKDIIFSQRRISLPIIKHLLDSNNDSLMSFIHWSIVQDDSFLAQLSLEQLSVYSDSNTHLANRVVKEGKGHLVEACFRQNPSLWSTPDHDGNTPLHCVADRGSPGLISKALCTGVDVNVRNNQGKTPLMMAISERHSAVIEQLSPVSDWRLQDNDGNTALDYLIQSENLFLIESVFSGFKARGKSVTALISQNPQHILLTVAKIGNSDLFKSIYDICVAYGIPIEERDVRKILIASIQKNSDNIVEFCLNDLSCRPNFINEEGETPCSLAVQKGHIYTLQLLIKYGANPFDSGQNLLRKAVEAGLSVSHIGEIIKILKGAQEEGGAALMEMLHDSPSPLYVAASVGVDQTIFALLEANTKITELQDSPLSIAAKNGYLKTYSILFDHLMTTSDIDLDTLIAKYLMVEIKVPSNLEEETLPYFHLVSWDTLQGKFPDKDRRHIEDLFEQAKRDFKESFLEVDSQETAPSEQISTHILEGIDLAYQACIDEIDSILNYEEQPILFFSRETWDSDTIRIVASRLVKKYSNPVFIGSSLESSDTHCRVYGFSDGNTDMNWLLRTCDSFFHNSIFYGNEKAGCFILLKEDMDSVKGQLTSYKTQMTRKKVSKLKLFDFESVSIFDCSKFTTLGEFVKSTRLARSQREDDSDSRGLNRLEQTEFEKDILLKTEKIECSPLRRKRSTMFRR